MTQKILLTGAKHAVFSTNHLADIDKTKHNDNQNNTNLNKQTREPTEIFTKWN